MKICDHNASDPGELIKKFMQKSKGALIVITAITANQYNTSRPISKARSTKKTFLGLAYMRKGK